MFIKKSRKPFSFINIFILFLVSRLFLAGVGLIGNNIFHGVSTNSSEWQTTNTHIAAIDMWGVWDSGWYLDIAKNGYINDIPKEIPWADPHGETNFGFFPLYPLLIHITNVWVRNYFISGLLISNFFLVLTLLFFQKLLLEDYDVIFVKRTLLYLLIFPTSFVLSGVFSESIFLFLTTVGFYVARQKRWGLVGISGLFAALCRPTGVLLAAPLGIVFVLSRSRKKMRHLTYFLLFPLGLFIFMSYCYVRTGDFFQYFHAQETGWEVHLTNPLSSIAYLLSFSSATRIITLFTLGELLFITLCVKRLKLEYSGYLLLLIGIPFFEGPGTFYSIMRMSAAAFPLFILLSSISENKRVNWIVTGYCIVVQAFFMILWSNGMGII